MKQILLEQHTEDCHAMQAVENGQWEHSWCCPEHHWLPRDRLGRNHPRALTEYLVWQCNAINCKARMAILYEDIERAIGLRR